MEISELLLECEEMYMQKQAELKEIEKKEWLAAVYENLVAEVSTYPKKISKKRAEIVLKNFSYYVK